MLSEIGKQIERSFAGVSAETRGEYRLKVEADKESVLSILGFLKNHSYDHLALISCVDRIEAGQLELVYLLNSYMESGDRYGEREKGTIILKTTVSRENPEIGTAIHVFQNAEPYERELHEMFGIDFDGHPRQIPLFLEKDYAIPPFRKDFDTRDYVEKELESIPAVED